MNLLSYINDTSPIDLELRTLFRKSDRLVVLDIGACEGEDSIRYRRMFPMAMVYSFEPLPSNLSRIEDNLLHFGVDDLIEVLPFALSDTEGSAMFYVSSGVPPQKRNDENWNYGNKSSSLLEPTIGLKENYAWLDFQETIEVKTKRLDAFCQEKNLQQIDFIHMDVQGAELKVLEGAGTSLKLVKAIWTEVENVELYKSQPLKRDVESFLRSHGFIKLTEAVSDVSGDQFYINQKMISRVSIFRYRILSSALRLLNKTRTFLRYFELR